MRIRERRLIRWVLKGGLALLDQGLFAGSNFVASILLARWLSPQEYGAYAVAFAVFLLLLVPYQALVLEPMLVFGGSAYRNCLRSYLKVLLVVHCAMGLVIVIALCAAAGVGFELDRTSSLPGALVGVAIATPLVLLFWLVKRPFYVMLSPAASVWGAIVYAALMMGGLTLVSRHGSLSPFSALLLMGLAGLGASLLLLAYLAFRLPASEHTLSLADTWRRHWHYGRWALGANVMMWIPVSIYYPLLSSFSGMTQAGELKALMNFLSPMLQTCAALASLMLPYGTRLVEERGIAGVSAVSKRMTLLCVCCALPYWALVLLFEGPAFHMLYSGRYTEITYMLPVVALTSICGSAFFGPSIALRAMEAPRSVFAAVFVSSCVSIAIGIPATWAFGLKGAVWSMALSEALAFLAAGVLVQQKIRAQSAAVAIPVAAAMNNS